jgi:hypothetical protein
MKGRSMAILVLAVCLSTVNLGEGLYIPSRLH